MRFASAIAAVLVTAAVSFGQQCNNGQCQRPSQVSYQAVSPTATAAPSEPTCQTATRGGLFPRAKANREARKDARAAKK